MSTQTLTDSDNDNLFSENEPKIPIIKSQISNNIQIRNPNSRNLSINKSYFANFVLFLNFGHWLLFGFWFLVLGILMKFIEQVSLVNPVSYLLK